MYTVRIPFSLAPNTSFTNPDEAFEAELDGFPLTVSRQDPHWVLKVSQLPSEEEATAFHYRLCVALDWASVARGLGTQFTNELRKPLYLDDPVAKGRNLAKVTDTGTEQPLDGYISGNAPAIFPSSKKFRAATALPLGVRKNYRMDEIASLVQEGLGIPFLREALNDPKIALAVETYKASWFEASRDAWFLGLMTVLEVLNSDAPASPKVVTLIDRWIQELPATRLEQDDLDSLKRRLPHLKTQAIRQGIRSLVQDALTEDGHEDAVEQGKRARDLYDIRSELVHDGKIGVRENEKHRDRYVDLQDIVRKTLLSVLRHGR